MTHWRAIYNTSSPLCPGGEGESVVEADESAPSEQRALAKDIFKQHDAQDIASASEAKPA